MYARVTKISVYMRVLMAIEMTSDIERTFVAASHST
jgi:hypothetical protein